MGQKERPVDYDLEQVLAAREALAKTSEAKPFNPNPSQWKKGTLYTQDKAMGVQVWCDHHREKEAWVPAVGSGDTALIKASGAVLFVPMISVSVTQDEEGEDVED